MQRRRKIAVAGATGRVGRHLVEVLEAAGHDVVPMSRSSGVNVVTGEGLSEALAGVQRIVVVSIIGTDRFTTGYIAAKVAHERAMQSGPIPVRILRAAQFHEFVAQFLEWGRQGDVIYVPQMRTQLVAARTVAEALADLANGSTPAPETSAATIPEIAGPREESLVDVARLLVARRGDSVRIEGVSDPEDPEQALYASGALLPGPDAVLAGPTFEQWLVSTA